MNGASRRTHFRARLRSYFAMAMPFHSALRISPPERQPAPTPVGDPRAGGEEGGRGKASALVQPGLVDYGYREFLPAHAMAARNNLIQ